ncbi:hypothetical protein TBH_C1456 [Thiolapillus brandeum]|uniref:Uncharacterized protein n=1 Tax=Thiolapillus brandeum TaxID=1076588 RepID=A0A7U6JHD8_9GAMM|nr:hypothetical protein TBH_C1456 [Thiolapillus brandeum]
MLFICLWERIIMLLNPATKYVALSASNRARIKARLAGNGKPLSKAATPIRALFEAPNKLKIKRKAALSAPVRQPLNLESSVDHSFQILSYCFSKQLL